jgi:hypothetical protein
MVANSKTYIFVLLITVFNLSCDSASKNEPGLCQANAGQPCSCDNNAQGTRQCVENQLVCVCGLDGAGNGSQPTTITSGGSSGNWSGDGSSGAGTGGAGTPDTAGAAGTAGTIGLTDAGPQDSGEPNPNEAAVVTDSSSTSNPDSNLPITGRFPPVDDVWSQGLYTPMTTNNTGPGNAYTLFYPQELAPNGALNPIITWGNGAFTTPSLYPSLLPHLASHGFVIIASNDMFVTGDEIRAGIDWLLEQNQNSTSPFYQKLDPNNVAAMGYSLGSLGTFSIADDQRLTTTVHISGGASGGSDVAKLHKMPAFFCDELTTAPNCQPDFDAATVPVFYGVFLGADHVGTMSEPYISRIAGAATGWLRWRLMADESQKALFVGADCQLCKDTNWKVQQKDIM